MVEAVYWLASGLKQENMAYIKTWYFKNSYLIIVVKCLEYCLIFRDLRFVWGFIVARKSSYIRKFCSPVIDKLNVIVAGCREMVEWSRGDGRLLQPDEAMHGNSQWLHQAIRSGEIKFIPNDNNRDLNNGNIWKTLFRSPVFR